MVKCKICKTETSMDETRLCDNCWTSLRWAPRLFTFFPGDVQITHEPYTEFPWTVHLRELNYNVKGQGQTLEEAYDNARKQMMV